MTRFLFSDDFEKVKGNKWFNSYIAVSPSTDHSIDPYCVLCNAAKNGNLALVQYLYHNGANINGKNENGQTPILLAALHGYQSIVKYLYKNGAGFHDGKLKNIEDVTPWPI